MKMTEKQEAALQKANAESRQFTREAIQDALFMLMRKKEYEKITITDIIRKSGVSRSAFYRNYHSKEDILMGTVEPIARNIFYAFKPSRSDGWLAVFQAAYDNTEKLQLIIDAKMETGLLLILNKRLPQEGTSYMVTAMWNGIIYNLVVEWIKRGRPLGVEKMAELAADLTKSLRMA